METNQEETGYIAVPGGNVWYKRVGEGTKTPIIMVHGGPGSTSHSLQTLGLLAKDRQVVFYDQLGCGESDRPKDRSLWHIERFIQELEIIRRKLTLPEVILLGHSWGSLLVAAYTLTHPEYVEAMILSGPLLSEPAWTRDAAILKKDLSPHYQEVIETCERNGTTDSDAYEQAVLEYYKLHLCRIFPFPKDMQAEDNGFGKDVYLTMWGPSEFTCTGNLKGYDITKEVHKIQIPVLLVCGRYDEARPETVKEYTSLFPNAYMEILEKSAHATYLEERDTYINIVEKFLAAHD